MTTSTPPTASIAAGYVMPVSTANISTAGQKKRSTMMAATMTAKSAQSKPMAGSDERRDTRRR